MVSRVARYIERHQLCSKSQRVLLAVSGGLDSMVMLHLLHSAGYQIAVAHCNFQLRDSDSEKDEKFVEASCKSLNVPFYSKRFDTNNYAVEQKLSIQVAARNLRYAWFDQLCNEEGFDCVATAHHANDNLETILLHLTRGTGISGAAGIPIRMGRVIRPLLGFTRDELRAYALENRIEWREDRSNDTDDYDRNFIRHNILPQLRSLNPSLDESMLQTQERLMGALNVFNLGLRELKNKYLKKVGDRIIIDKAILKSTPFPAVVIWELVKKFGFNFKQIQEVVEVEESGRHFIAGDYHLVVDRNEWIVHQPGAIDGEVLIRESDSSVSFRDQKLRIEVLSDKTIEPDPHVAKLDRDSLRFPIIWRKWKEGDAFYPLGMDHRKKVSDFLIDCKVSIADKERVTVLESQGDIVWVVGYRIDNRNRITVDTEEVVRFTLL
ncbi:MAG: tRNA lysidine(34) synthetase TilS [Cyclobacteriaceae bacterium]